MHTLFPPPCGQSILLSKRRSTKRSGFTLIEIMAVIVILGILMTFLLTTLGGSGDVVRAKNTGMFIDQVSTLLVDYETQKGDFPASTFPGDLPDVPSTGNMGAEMLVISLYPGNDSFAAQDVGEDRLSNTDGDMTKKSLTSFSSGEVFELSDDWGNPIAYIHRRDYSKRFAYVTNDPVTGELIDNDVQAYKSNKTGDFFHRKRFQLISAGPDGAFGTEDDIGNFKLEKE